MEDGMEKDVVGGKVSSQVSQVGGDHYAKGRAVCPHCHGALQHWDYAAGLPYLIGQISKYTDRHLEKNGFQDLLKAQSYLTKAMLFYYPEEYAKHQIAEAASHPDPTAVIATDQLRTLLGMVAGYLHHKGDISDEQLEDGLSADEAIARLARLQPGQVRSR
jgi:cytochrome c553